MSGPARPSSSVVELPGELDNLFVELRRARDPAQADAARNQIWLYWLRTPDAASASAMNRAFAARRVADYDKAMAELDGVVTAHPAYAEGWNQRAFIHFLREDFEASLADCEKAIALEPRHFGCLTGMGLALMRQGRMMAARRALEKAVKLDPFLNERGLLKTLPETQL